MELKRRTRASKEKGKGVFYDELALRGQMNKVKALAGKVILRNTRTIYL